MGAGELAGAGTDARGLLPLVFSRPRQVLTMAHALLAADPTPYDASIAHQAVGIVQREFGDVSGALDHLRTAVRLARRSGSTDREADVLATLGVALVQAGRPGPGMASLHRAVARAEGLTSARATFRRGGALRILGRHREALRDLNRAVPALRRAADTVWLARALNIRALVKLALGAGAQADADLRAAELLFTATQQVHDSALVLQNRGHAAYLAGDLPAALSYLDDAGRRLAELGDPLSGLYVDRCDVLLAAGLAQDALAVADAAIVALDRQRGQATRKALLVLAAARAALAAEDRATAVDRATLATRMFAAQRRPWWLAQARLLQLQARFEAGGASPRLVRDAAAAAQALVDLGSAESTQAHLLAGRAARALGRSTDADRHLAAAATARRHGTALARVGGWLAEALRADAAGRVGPMLRACARGLDILDEHRLTLGAAELRALAGAHGAELTALAQRACLRSAQNRALLRWTERGRAAVLAVPAVRPLDDRALQADLTAFRDVTARLEQARSQGAAASGLRRDQKRLERDRLEREIRARVLRTRGHRRTAQWDGRLDVGVLLDRLGSDHLVQLVDVDGELHALVCGANRVRRAVVGPLAVAVAEVEFARSALRRITYHGDRDRFAILEVTARRLEAALFGQAVHLVGDGPVTIVPPSRLHGVPWALLPSLRDRVHSVAPSSTAWLRASAVSRPASHDVALVRGPGLSTGGAEIAVLARLYPHATVLEAGTATAPRVLAALDGAWLAHIAAHGSYRSDSPLFSSLHLDDGPLTVHDLGRLRRAPYRLVLPACDSGQLTAIGPDDLLGLATALLPLGTAGVLASLLPVNDPATVGLMVALHDGLSAGASLAEALHRARRAVPDDPVHRATAWSFVAIGPA